MRMGRKLMLLVLVICWAVLLAGCMQVNSPPVARFTRNPSSGEAPLFVTFDATSSTDRNGYIVAYSWAFGDGSSGTGVTSSHTYTTAGNYAAALTVRDDAGGTDSATHSVSVAAPSTPTLPSPTPGVDYSVTAGQILDEFETNEIAATLKYQNKTIAVSGYVDSTGMSITDRPYVTLIRSPGLWTLRTVWCYFPVSAMSALASLREGDHVTIVGDFDDYLLVTVWLENCHLH